MADLISDPIDELLQAVFLGPGDNTARLVLADYLMDRGDPRGELIHIQCMLATASGSWHAELSARERELLQARTPPRHVEVGYARGLCELARVESNWSDDVRPFLEGELVIDRLVLLGCGGSSERWKAIGRLLTALTGKLRTVAFEGVIWHWRDSDTEELEEIDERAQLTAVLEAAPRPRYFVDLQVPEGTTIPRHWRSHGP